MPEPKDADAAASKLDAKLHADQAGQKAARHAVALGYFQAGACSRRRQDDDQGLRFGSEMTMVRETKFFRKQAEKAERMALAVSDQEVSQNLSNLALAYRSQANALKKSKKKSGNKDKPKANKQKKKK